VRIREKQCPFAEGSDRRLGEIHLTKEEYAMLHYERRRQTLTVRLQDELDHNSAVRLRGELDELLRDGSIRRLVLDLKELSFMDSSGVGFIIGRYKVMARRGGSVAVMNADRQMDRIFKMSGLYELVERLA